MQYLIVKIHPICLYVQCELESGLRFLLSTFNSFGGCIKISRYLYNQKQHLIVSWPWAVGCTTQRGIKIPRRCRMALSRDSVVVRVSIGTPKIVIAIVKILPICLYAQCELESGLRFFLYVFNSFWWL